MAIYISGYIWHVPVYSIFVRGAMSNAQCKRTCTFATLRDSNIAKHFEIGVTFEICTCRHAGACVSQRLCYATCTFRHLSCFAQNALCGQ